MQAQVQTTRQAQATTGTMAGNTSKRSIVFCHQVSCYAATDTGTNYVLSPLKASGEKVMQNINQMPETQSTKCSFTANELGA